MEIKESYLELHKLFNLQPRQKLPIDKREIPKNGIYILFEEGEKEDGGLDRIVRVGTHTGDGNLAPRMRQHFRTKVEILKQNSIFRKHIGRCYLNQKGDTYLEKWNLPIKKRTDKEKNLSQKDKSREIEIETFIDDYMKGLSYVIIPNVDNKIDRLELENALISTIAQYSNKRISNNWLGSYHPDKRVNNSGIWNIVGLKSAPITKKMIDKIRRFYS